MKKTVLMALLTMIMIGCNEKKSETADNDNTGTTPTAGLTECLATNTEAFKSLSVECQNNELIRGLLCVSEENRVEWLQTNGVKICQQDLYECIEPMHFINDISNFKTLAMAHPENKVEIKYYDKTWKQIKDTLKGVGCYEAYLSFDLSTDKVNLKKVKDFTVEHSCYSLPFLIGLERKYELVDTDIIQFTKAMVNVTVNEHSTPKEKVIFKIEKNNLEAGYYDLSDFPGMLGYYIPCGL